MGRQWLHAKRAIVNLKKGQTVGKLVKEMTVAAKLGGGDLEANARLHAAVEKAKKASVTRDVIQRAIAKGAGTGGEGANLEHVVYEGYAPHKVPVIIEVMTDNHNRSSSDLRVLFKKGQLGGAGSTEANLKSRVHAILDKHALDYDLAWEYSPPYITPRGNLVEAISEAIQASYGVTPELSTTGGTSDGRFIADICKQVIEFGPLNATIHKLNECVAVKDIEPLKETYKVTLEKLIK